MTTYTYPTELVEKAEYEAHVFERVSAETGVELIEEVKRLRAFRSFLEDFVAGSEPGRWLDSQGTETYEGDPDGEYEEYTLEEQCAWVEAMKDRAEKLLQENDDANH